MTKVDYETPYDEGRRWGQEEGYAAGFTDGLLAGLEAADGERWNWSWTHFINWRLDAIAHVRRTGRLPEEKDADHA
jgi:hypothetical protein